MPERDRTTISLPQFYMDYVEDLVGVISVSRAGVISKIIQIFFDKTENIEYINNLSKARKVMNNKKLDPKILEEKLKEFLEFSNYISIQDILEYLNIDMDIFRDNFLNWAKNLNLRYENERIIKNY